MNCYILFNLRHIKVSLCICTLLLGRWAGSLFIPNCCLQIFVYVFLFVSYNLKANKNKHNFIRWNC